MQTVLHKDGEQYAIVTTAENEQDFRMQFAEALDNALNGDAPPNGWAFEIEQWLKPCYEIVCKFRGYKADVVEQRTLIAGHVDPDAPFITIQRGNGVPVASS